MGRSPSPTRNRWSRSPSPPASRHRSAVVSLRRFMHGELGDVEARGLAEELFFESLPRENVGALEVDILANENSQRRFLESMKKFGSFWSKVRVTWHLPGSAHAAASIRENGISCDEE